MVKIITTRGVETRIKQIKDDLRLKLYQQLTVDSSKRLELRINALVFELKQLEILI